MRHCVKLKPAPEAARRNVALRSPKEKVGNLAAKPGRGAVIHAAAVAICALPEVIRVLPTAEY